MKTNIFSLHSPTIHSLKRWSPCSRIRLLSVFFTPHLVTPVGPLVLESGMTVIPTPPPLCFMYLRETQENILRLVREVLNFFLQKVGF